MTASSTTADVSGVTAESSEVVALQERVRALESLVRDLSAVAETQRSISPVPQLEQLLADVIGKIKVLLDVDKAGVRLFDPARNELVLQRPAYGSDDVLTSKYPVPLDGGGNAVTVFLTGEPYVSNDSFNDPRIIKEYVEAFDLRSVLTVPLSVENRRIGVLHVCNKRSGAFDQNDLFLVQFLANHLAALIENAKLHEREEHRIRQLEELNQALSDRSEKLQQAIAIHERLTEMSLEDSGIDRISATLAGLVENPVAVEDKFARLVSYASHPIESHAADGPEFVGTPTAVLNDSLFQDLVKLVESTKRPVRIPAYPNQGVRWSRLTAAITAGRTVFGYVSVFEKTHQLRELDLVAAQHAATVFALEFQKQKVASEVEQRLKGDFLDDLLAGDFDSSEVMLRRAALLDHDLSHPHVLIVFDIDEFGVLLDKHRLDEREAVSIKKSLFETVLAVAAEKSPKIMVVTKSDSVIVLFDLVADAGAGVIVDPDQLVARIRQEISARLPKLSVSVAVSTRCECAEEYQHAYRVAKKSLDLLKVFKQGDRVLRLERLGVYQLLMEIEDKAKLKRFVDQFIGPLADYDSRHNTSLIDTLESYLQNDCNLYKTARVSFLHVNTVKYRLRRIQEIGKVELSDPEARMALHLGLKVWRLID